MSNNLLSGTYLSGPLNAVVSEYFLRPENYCFGKSVYIIPITRRKTKFPTIDLVRDGTSRSKNQYSYVIFSYLNCVTNNTLSTRMTLVDTRVR